jgi:hypothetical protein
MTEIILPVSLGEALDKLTILDIKLEMIKDSRRNNVMIEYDLLYDKLKNYVESFEYLYKLMKNINKQIWFEMDELRDGSIFDENYLKICKQTMIDNDIRFRIKNKINILTNSNIKEQKGYKIIQIYLYLDNLDIKLHEFCINYFSIRYDEVYVDSNFKCELINKYNYDMSIKFIKNNNISNIFELSCFDTNITLQNKLDLTNETFLLYI